LQFSLSFYENDHFNEGKMSIVYIACMRERKNRLVWEEHV
jgi:hypothetical protein